MTTIVYKNGILAADSRQIFGDDINPLVRLKSKLILSKNKTMGYSFTGNIPSNKSINLFETKLEKGLSMYENDIPNNDSLDNAFKDISLITGNCGTLIVMTREGLYLYDATYKFNDITDLDYYVLGSGSFYAETSLHNHSSAINAVKYASKHDPMTGCDIYAIKQNKLNKLFYLKDV